VAQQTTAIKFMGRVDRRVIPAGEDWGGRLQDPLSRDLVWDKSNNWILDVSDLPAEVVALVLAEPNMRDVTGQRMVPPNDYQKAYLRMKDVEIPASPSDEGAPSENPGERPLEGGVEASSSDPSSSESTPEDKAAAEPTGEAKTEGSDRKSRRS